LSRARELLHKGFLHILQVVDFGADCILFFLDAAHSAFEFLLQRAFELLLLLLLVVVLGLVVFLDLHGAEFVLVFVIFVDAVFDAHTVVALDAGLLDQILFVAQDAVAVFADGVAVLVTLHREYFAVLALVVIQVFALFLPSLHLLRVARLVVLDFADQMVLLVDLRVDFVDFLLQVGHAVFDYAELPLFFC